MKSGAVNLNGLAAIIGKKLKCSVEIGTYIGTSKFFSGKNSL